MSHTFYFLGDIASKPLNMDWAQEDGPKTEWFAGQIYNVYNWLMLKSVSYNDKSDCGVWMPHEDEPDEE